MCAVFPSALNQAARANFESISPNVTESIYPWSRNCEPYHDYPHRSRYTAATKATKICSNEAGNNRNPWGLRLGPHDQGGRRANLPNGRLLLRQRRARCCIVQPRGTRIPVHAYQKPNHGRTGTTGPRTRGGGRRTER